MAHVSTADGFLLLLLLTLTCNVTSGKGCPTGCQCLRREISDSLTVCTGSNLTSVPENVPSATKDLYIKDSNIQQLPQDAFVGLPSLTVLHITDSNLRSITPGAFSGLDYLSSLCLTSNRLQVLLANTFKGLPLLKTLILDNNNIRMIEDFAFHGLNLNYLGLENNLELEEISPRAFNGSEVKSLYMYNSTLSEASATALKPLQETLRNLFWQYNRVPLTFSEDQFNSFSFRTLNLNHNEITNTDFLRYVETMSLSLEGNPTGHIDFSRYQRLSSVESLQLQGTRTSHVDGELFEGLSNLEELHLSDNYIHHLPKGLEPVLSQLKSFTLGENPLHCNCEMIWFRRWLEQREDAREIGAECHSPRNEPLVELTEDDLLCIAPNKVNITRGRANDELILTCTAHGDPAPWVTWELPDWLLSAREQTNTSIALTTNVLRIQHKEWTGGATELKCLAENEKGRASAVIHIEHPEIGRDSASGGSDVLLSKWPMTGFGSAWYFITAFCLHVR